MSEFKQALRAANEERQRIYDLDDRQDEARMKIRRDLADIYVREFLGGVALVTRVGETNFKLKTHGVLARNQKSITQHIDGRGNAYTAVITWKQAENGELPQWLMCGENMGPAPAPSNRTSPAKKKPGRRNKAKTRKQKRKKK